jgi:hypothetical protein
MTLGSQLIGTWRLFARDDHTLGGEPRVDPILGADPIAILIYDTAGNFAAQFMKRDRSAAAVVAPAPSPAAPTRPGGNNSTAVNGYDAYFGTYTVDETSGTVTQTLVGSLSAGDVGKVVTREMRIIDGKLTIQLQTNNAHGEAVIRTLRWTRDA